MKGHGRKKTKGWCGTVEFGTKRRGRGKIDWSLGKALAKKDLQRLRGQAKPP